MFFIILLYENIIKNYAFGHSMIFVSFPNFHPDRHRKNGAQMKKILETMASFTPISTKEIVDLESNTNQPKNCCFDDTKDLNDVMLVGPSDPNSRTNQVIISNGDKNRLLGNVPLNDELLSFGMLYYRLELLTTPTNTKKVYNFHPQMNTKLTEETSPDNEFLRYRRVYNWALDENLFEYTYLLFPIMKDFHIFLIAYYKPFLSLNGEAAVANEDCDENSYVKYK
jgi:hypothetical protein